MQKYQKILVFICLIMICLFSAANALAVSWRPIVPCGRGCTEWAPDGSCIRIAPNASLSAAQPCRLCHVWQLISNVINFLIFEVAIPVSVIMFAASGIIYLTAGDNVGRVDLAKKILRRTIIGLIVIFCSWLLIDSLMKSIAGGGFMGAWNQFPKC